MTDTDIGTVEVCVDCYFAHHYGATVEALGPTDGAEWVLIDWDDVDQAREEGWLLRFYSGESDTPCEREPLGDLPEYGHESGGQKVTAITDFTCSNHFYDQDVTPDTWDDESGEPEPTCDHCGQTGWEDGITEFTWRSCDGCGSHLGGSRHRLAIHWEKIA